MTKTDVFSFINENMSCNLATCIDNKPQTRWMLMYKADSDGIVFHTGTMRDLYRSLLANPQVELCFFNGKPENMIQIRVSGTVEEDKDPVLRKEIIQARPFLNKVIAEYGEESIAPFRLRNMVASVWTMEKNTEPKEMIPLD